MSEALAALTGLIGAQKTNHQEHDMTTTPLCNMITIDVTDTGSLSSRAMTWWLSRGNLDTAIMQLCYALSTHRKKELEDYWDGLHVVLEEKTR